MKSYSEREIFGCEELAMLEWATKLIDWVHDEVVSTYPAWRCHELARAVRKWLFYGPLNNKAMEGIHVVDGKFGRVDHSWIAYRAPEQAMSPLRILDVYCVARLPQVQLIDCYVGTEILGLYKPDHMRRTDIDTQAIDYLVSLWDSKHRLIEREREKDEVAAR